MYLHQIRWSLAAVLIIGSTYAFAMIDRAQARPTAQLDDTTLLAPLPFNEDGTVSFFGGAVAMDGDTLVIGATGTEVTPDDDQTQLLGAAYIYTLTETGNEAGNEADNQANSGANWTQQAKLIPEDFETFDQQASFGHAVAIDGDTVVIGASRNRLEGLRGGVYVFTGSGSEWELQARLSLSNTADELLAGETVAIAGNTIAVGMPDTTGGDNEIGGAVHLFERTGTDWNLSTTLSATNESGNPSDTFGAVVALDQNRLVVGHNQGATGFPQTRGAIHVYSKVGNAWQLEAKLNNPVNSASAALGSAVALEGDVIVAGAEGEKIDNNILQGAAHIFIRRPVGNNNFQWQHAYRLTAPDGATTDYFGRSVSIKNGLIVVGAYWADTDAIDDRGAAYVFAPAGGAWVNVLKLLAANGSEDDVLGAAVTNNGEWVAIGAPHIDGIGEDNIGQTYMVQVQEFPEGFAHYMPLLIQP